MIWVEILSRHRDVVARHPVATAEVHIGRGYNNDVIIDDPYVAAQHLRIFRDENGRLVAEDMGSANGMFLDRGRTPLERIIVDGKNPIRIGQTYLRVRETNYAVERERTTTRPQLRALPVALPAALSVMILGIYALEVWLAQTTEPKVSSYLAPLLGIATGVLMWVGFWALLSRIFCGHSRFLRNLLIALLGVLVLLLYNEFAQFCTFALTWPTAEDYGYVAMWSILATVCFFHLREVSPSHPLLKSALLMTVVGAAIAVQTVHRSEAFSDSGRQNTLRRLMPSALRLVPLRDENSFFAEIAKIKTRLDRDRARAKAIEADQ
jgi:hypothetical protein